MAADSKTVTADCPRCATGLVTFDVRSWVGCVGPPGSLHRYEIFARCRKCFLPTTFLIESQYSNINIENLSTNYLDSAFEIISVVTIMGTVKKCPLFTPKEIASLFDEAEKCRAVGAFDACGSMYRKVIDTATRRLLPKQPKDESSTTPGFVAWKIRRDLRLRLNWLFAQGILAARLAPLAECVREDGNDATHDEGGIGAAEAADLLDFTTVLLEELFLLPGQIAENVERRKMRRSETSA